MTTIACVLRMGGDFDDEWVYKLQRGVSKHLPRSSFKFRCLTDSESLLRKMPWATPLWSSWPKWWAKMELFRPGVFDGPTLCMDLDTLPVGDLSDLVSYAGELALISDFYRPALAMNGVMVFTPGRITDQIWSGFTKDPEAAMAGSRGDGYWIRENGPFPHDRLQDLYPGQVVSLKAGGPGQRGDDLGEGPPENARLVCGHGPPRFSDPLAGWAHKAWENA